MLRDNIPTKLYLRVLSCYLIAFCMMGNIGTKGIPVIEKN